MTHHRSEHPLVADTQPVAPFITAKPRPSYPFKHRDYTGGKVPLDAVYYDKR